MIKVRCDEMFPADLIFLFGSSAECGGQCHVETANIDGETNLKAKEALFPSAPLGISEGDILVNIEAPTDQIYKFRGSAHIRGEVKSLSVNNLLLRGSSLKNTEWIVGLVVYTGNETRIQQNSASSTPLKMVHFDRLVNAQMYWMLVILVSLVVVTFLYWTILANSPSYMEMDPTKWTFKSLFLRFCTYLVLYHSIVPISLLVTMEFVRYQLAKLISSDLELFDEEIGPIKIQNSSIVDELGQVQYVLTDKTGTLTKNQMDLVAISDISGQKYRKGKEFPEGLVKAMLLCHSVLVASNGDLQGSSPDEVAIIRGCGVRFDAFLIERTPRQIVISVSGRQISYELLHVFEYSSEKKRMSVVVRDRSGRIKLIMKGADDVVLALSKKGDHSGLSTSISDFSQSGLRTLCYAERVLSESEWAEFQGSLTLGGKQESLENDIHALGATAVEDCLADGVPQTLKTLQKAGIKIWMLTGDRMGTAKSVGIACELIYEHHQIIQVALISDFEECRVDSNSVLIIDGSALDSILNFSTDFIEKSIKCQTVIFCRVTPAQKRKIAELLKAVTGSICLAIGDGANDVGMIQTANVGIGLLGLEGRQAARSADIALPCFHYLVRLLLVHGSWSYHRMAKTIIFCVYKNCLLITCQFWYCFISNGSGQTLFETWMLSLFNVIFTAGIPVVIGLTDQHITAPFLLRHPELYQQGQRNDAFAVGKFWKAAFNGFLQSFLIDFLIAGLLFGDGSGSGGLVGGLWTLGCCIYVSALVTILLKACLLLNAWNPITVTTILVSALSWFAYLIIYDYLVTPSAPLYGMAERLLIGMPAFWPVILLTPLVVLARDVIWKYVRRSYMPREYHIVQELELRRHQQV